MKRGLTKRADVQVIAKTETAAARRAEELIDLITRRASTISEAFYDIGVALGEILKKKLYGALGYKSFDALLAHRKLMSRTQATKLIEVSHAMSRDAAIKLGLAKAYAAARLVAATPEPDTVTGLLAKGVRTGKHGHGRKTLEHMSVREVEDAAQKVRRKKEGKGAEQKAAEAAAKLARVALVAAGFRVLECDAIRRSMEWIIRIEAKPKKV
jgi:hypothetical protein